MPVIIAMIAHTVTGIFEWLVRRFSINIKQRRISAHVSTVRRMASRHVGRVQAKENKTTYSNLEMDSHADTIVLGRNCAILSYSGRECDVSPYTDSYESIKGVPIVTGATAWTSQVDGATYILVFHEALWMGDVLEHSLLNPNQLRHYGVSVQDNPYADVEMHLETEDGGITIPMKAEGTTIYIPTRTPTDRELQECPHIMMSSKSEWNPRDLQFPEPANRVEQGLFQPRISSAYTNTMAMNPDSIVERLIAEIRVDMPDDVPTRRTFISKERHLGVSAEEISDRWGIGLMQAANTVKVTTQRGTRSALLPLSRRYRADRVFEKPLLRGEFYTDTLDGRCKSLDGNRYAQVFANKNLFAVTYPMQTKSLAGEGLRQFIHDYGRPEKLTFDGSGEQCGRKTEFMKNVRKYSISHHVIEPERHNHNAAEGVIREIRKKWYRIMVRKKVPKRLWDYGMRWVSEIQNRTSNSARGLDGKCPLERVTGESVDISEYLDFGFYDWAWYKENAGLGETKIGRWLGVSHRIGSLMSFWILTKEGRVISRTTVQRVTNLELQTSENRQQTESFDRSIAENLGSAEYFIEEGDGKVTPVDWGDSDGYDAEFQEEFNKVVSDTLLPEADEEFSPDVFDDTYLNMELALPRSGGEIEFAKVTKRLRDKDGLPIGTANDNPILDTRIYDMEIPDGHKSSLAANAIAENLFAQVDDEGNRHVLFDEITSHRTNGKELKQQDAFITTSQGTKRRKETTIGWEMLVQWKDQSTTWVSLKDMKDAYPVQVAEYAVSTRISEEPAFAWWVPYTLRKRNRIISKLKSKYWVRTHKFGIKIPKTAMEAKAFDLENGNTLWWDAICKEMRNVRPAFEVWDKDQSAIPIGYQEVKCHLIFDIKMGENFRRKARFVAGGHTTDVPSALTYASVVSRDSVRIALTIAALNDLQVLACDIQNAYLTADCREKIWTRAGPEFGSEVGTIFMVRKALYGLKSAGAAFRSLLAETLHDIGYTPTKADPDVWLRPAVKADGFQYYELILCYVDDILSISADPAVSLRGLQDTFKLKDDKVEVPGVYLGAGLGKMQVDGFECWTMSAEKYVTAVVKNVEETLAKRGLRLPSKCFTPLPSDYRPELEVSAELRSDGVQYYQELIGVLRWAVEIGRVDILLETALMSTHLALPRIGHLEQVYRIFGYLKIHLKRKLAFDAQHPMISERMFKKCDWSDFYRGVEEAIPGDMPNPRGNAMSTHCFVDASHGSDRATRRSQTGILIFCNKAPIIWHSKRQNTVEASTFGSEFQALKNAVELIESLRYKLRMFGVPIEGPTNIFCDNEAVYKNTSLPESVLKKKHHSIAYHRCREAVAAETVRVAKEGTRTNLSDLFTKLLPQARRDELLDRFTY